MELALEIPIHHWNDFYPYTSFDYALAHLVLEEGEYATFYKNLSREGERAVWLDNSTNELGKPVTPTQLMKAMDIIDPTHIVLMEDPTSADKNYQAIETSYAEIRRHGYTQKTIGTWRGTREHLNKIMQLCDVVALPFDEPREQVMTRLLHNRVHYFGFRSLQELKYAPPASLDTSVPIRMAMVGLDISLHSHRPKRLPAFNHKARLNEDQLWLAQLNIRRVLEAGHGILPKRQER